MLHWLCCSTHTYTHTHTHTHTRRDVKSSTFMSDLAHSKPVPLFLLQKVPHIIPHKEVSVPLFILFLLFFLFLLLLLLLLLLPFFLLLFFLLLFLLLLLFFLFSLLLLFFFLFLFNSFQLLHRLSLAADLIVSQVGGERQGGARHLLCSQP